MPDALANFEVDELVAIVTINRPEKLNAINREPGQVGGGQIPATPTH